MGRRFSFVQYGRRRRAGVAVPPASAAVGVIRGVSSTRAAVARSDRGMVATTDVLASEVGARVLAAGGNAIDAAVAAAFALAVVNPEAGNLGGGGFLLYRAPGGRCHVLDFRSVAPRAAEPRDGGCGSEGHRAAAVPGTVPGLDEAHRVLGSMPWTDLVDPAVSLAEGFTVGPRLVRSFRPHIVEALRRFPRSAEVLLPRSGDGGLHPPREGDRFRQADLARTLRRVGERGADEFRVGPTARLIVEEMRGGGGLVAADDLVAYRPVWRDPVRVPFAGTTVIATPPPSSAALVPAPAGALWSRLDPGDLIRNGAGHVHLLTEIWRRAFRDRNQHLADPHHASVPLAELTSPGRASAWAGSVDPDRASRSSDLRSPGHTTHLSVVDADGGAVSLTTTINTWYGSKVVVGGAGFLMNGDMDDFSHPDGAPNHFGLAQSPANLAAPGKRMASTMSPTLVVAGEGRAEHVTLALGSPGGATIPTTVFQVLVNRLVFGTDLVAAVDAARVHHQHRPDEIRVEPGGLDAGVLRALRERGHAVVEAEEPWGDVQAVARAADGTLLGVSDGRRGGAPVGA